MSGPPADGAAPREGAATLGGLLAILLWSTTVGVGRSLTEAVGPVTAGVAVLGVSGGLALARLAASPARRRQVARLPRRYLAGCGALFAGYMLLILLAIGLAADRRQVLEVGLLNYLWPVLTLLLLLALVGGRARPALLPGTLLALAGIFLVLTAGEAVSWASLAANLAENPAAYLAGLGAGVTWALYSALTRKWAGGLGEGGVGLFLPASFLCLLALSAFVAEPRAWSGRAAAEAAFLGAATFVAYSLWDHAMRVGRAVVVAAASYLTPLLSTLVSAIYLAVAPGPAIWAGSALLVAGSLLSRWSVVATEPRPPAARSSPGPSRRRP